jgi:hypothetical protein
MIIISSIIAIVLTALLVKASIILYDIMNMDFRFDLPWPDGDFQPMQTEEIEVPIQNEVSKEEACAHAY